MTSPHLKHRTAATADAAATTATTTGRHPRPSRRRGVTAMLSSAVLSAAVLLAGSNIAAADMAPVMVTAEPMPTNALAADVTATSRLAVDLYDSYRATNDRVTYRQYVSARAETARLAARQLGYPELDMTVAWSEAPLEHQRAVLAAMTQVGVPYRKNTSEEGVGFDCSGITTFAWRAAGYELFRQSGTQIKQAAPLDRQSAKAGDLVYYPGHVMMYLGVGDAIIHSVQTGRTVEIDLISGRRSKSVRFGDPTL